MPESRGTGGYGLPAEYRTPEGQLEDWSTTMGYLSALANSRRPIVVAVDTRDAHERLTQQIGFLRHDGRHRLPPSQPEYESFSVYWPDPNQLAGRVALYEHRFEGAMLSTADGDDYFGLGMSFGEVRIVFLDSNTHLDRAHPNRKRELDDLWTAEDYGRDWAARGDVGFVRELRKEIAAWRAQLVERGAEEAARMSDEELMAEGVKVRWKMRQHLVTGESVSEAEWISRVTEEIAGHRDEAG